MIGSAKQGSTCIGQFLNLRIEPAQKPPTTCEPRMEVRVRYATAYSLYSLLSAWRVDKYKEFSEATIAYISMSGVSSFDAISAGYPRL